MNRISALGLGLAACVLTLLPWSAVRAQESVDVGANVNSQPVAEPRARLEAASASPGIQLKTTSVTGSRELPKVLVIVPWKSSEAMGPGARPLASLVEEALTPVDPDVFRRQLSYYTKLKDAAAKTSSGEE